MRSINYFKKKLRIVIVNQDFLLYKQKAFFFRNTFESELL